MCKYSAGDPRGTRDWKYLSFKVRQAQLCLYFRQHPEFAPKPKQRTYGYMPSREEFDEATKMKIKKVSRMNLIRQRVRQFKELIDGYGYRARAVACINRIAEVHGEI